MIAEPQGTVSAALHAPTSGVIKAIEPRFHPVQARMADAIILQPDGEHVSDESVKPLASDLEDLTPEAIRTIARQMGLVAVSYTHLDVYKRQG